MLRNVVALALRMTGEIVSLLRYSQTQNLREMFVEENVFKRFLRKVDVLLDYVCVFVLKSV